MDQISISTYAFELAAHLVLALIGTSIIFSPMEYKKEGDYYKLKTPVAKVLIGGVCAFVGYNFFFNKVIVLLIDLFC